MEGAGAVQGGVEGQVAVVVAAVVAKQVEVFRAVLSAFCFSSTFLLVIVTVVINQRSSYHLNPVRIVE